MTNVNDCPAIWVVCKLWNSMDRKQTIPRTHLVEQDCARHVTHLLFCIPTGTNALSLCRPNRGKQLGLSRWQNQTYFVAGIRSAACLCPNSTSYPSMNMYSNFHTYFFLSYSAQDGNLSTSSAGIQGLYICSNKSSAQDKYL